MHADIERRTQWMQRALDQARLALDAGEAPIGCVLLDARGEVVGAGHNTMHATGVVTAHAEINAFADAGRRIEPDHSYTLVSTLEPCVMCLAAAMQAGVTAVVYGLRAPADAGSGRIVPPESPHTTAPTIHGQVCAGESRELFEQWLRRHAGDSSRDTQREFIKQLLAITDDPADT